MNLVSNILSRYSTFIRNYMPFIMLGISFLFSILEVFFIYDELHMYLGNIFGYSIITNLFMLTVYMNKKYCLPIKTAVFGLIAMNIFSMIGYRFGFYSVYYNIILEVAILSVVTCHIIKKR